MIVSFTFIQNDCFLCQSIQKEKKLSKDENTEDIILPTPSSPPPPKKNLKWFEVAKLWQY